MNTPRKTLEELLRIQLEKQTGRCPNRAVNPCDYDHPYCVFPAGHDGNCCYGRALGEESLKA